MIRRIRFPEEVDHQLGKPWMYLGATSVSRRSQSVHLTVGWVSTPDSIRHNGGEASRSCAWSCCDDRTCGQEETSQTKGCAFDGAAIAISEREHGNACSCPTGDEVERTEFHGATVPKRKPRDTRLNLVGHHS